MTRVRGFIGVLMAMTLAASPALAATHEFYKGKTIRIVVGYAPGGGFDTYSRLIARHASRHIPGNPTVIVENMPGAGGLIAANQIYKVARPDGLTIANISGALVLGQLLGQPGIEFDARKLEWIGVPTGDYMVCALTKATGVTSMDRWAAAKTPVKMGGVGTNSPPTNTAKILKVVLDLPIHVVSGYKGTADIRLAAESGELGGACWEWHSMRVTWRKALEAGDAVAVLQVTDSPLPDLPNVPLAVRLAKTEEARTLIRVGISDQTSLSRLYVVSPGTPKERVQALRKAFVETLKDPELLAEAGRAKLEVGPISGEEVERTIGGLFQLDPALVTRLKEILLR